MAIVAISSVLAKIFMVTKLKLDKKHTHIGSVLAKIFMVTKHKPKSTPNPSSSVLAKIFMVTKQDKVIDNYQGKFCSSKNLYGNKTIV